MSPSDVQRKLTAILVADVVGYSRLMEENEAATLRTLTGYRQVFSETIKEFRGRVVNAPGDSILAEFASVVDAVEGAVEIQRELAGRNADLVGNRRMAFRIGINLGDVLVKDEVIYGDGVNVAARLESLAEPGGICVSRHVYDHVKQKLKLQFDYLGEQQVKNIAEPVRAYRVLTEPGDAAYREVQANEAAREEKYPALPGKPSIAVMPFRNLSNDPEQEFFSDGLTEDITTDLSACRWLFVVARDTTLTYKNRIVEAKQAGREMGVRYLLEGSVRKEGEKIRISARLIDTPNGNQVWAERYDRMTTDIFQVQDELTRTIIAALRPEVETAEQVRAKRKPPESIDAWEAFQIGLSSFYQKDEQGNKTSRTHFEHALKLDPEFAAAYAGLANTYLFEAVFQRFDLDVIGSLLERGIELAKTSIALDNGDAFGHVVLGRLYLAKSEYAQAETNLNRALQLDPNSASCYAALSVLHSFGGNAEEGIHNAEMALRLSPRDKMRWIPMNSIAFGLMRLGRLDEGLEWIQKTIQENPAGYWPYVHKVVCLVNLGCQKRVREALAEVLRVEPRLSLTFICNWVKNMYALDPRFSELYVDALRHAGLPE